MPVTCLKIKSRLLCLFFYINKLLSLSVTLPFALVLHFAITVRIFLRINKLSWDQEVFVSDKNVTIIQKYGFTAG